MTQLGIRARFAVLTAALVFLIAALVGTGGYLALRRSLLDRAQREVVAQARQLAGLVDVRGEQAEGQANQVDIGDPSLTGGFARGGLLVDVVRPDGRRIQATAGAPTLPPAVRGTCLRSGRADATVGDGSFAVACVRVGTAAAPAALIAVAAPLAGVHHVLTTLARALAAGVLTGTLAAALLARALAQRALRPAQRIAQTAASIRAGELGRRIHYRGPRDELGDLADVLDKTFAELEAAVERQRRFVADASHELRTPIATIQAHVEVLRNWAAGRPHERERALAALDAASRAAGRLSADLLYLARLDRLPPAPRRALQLDQVLVDAIRQAQPLRPDVPIRVARLDEAQLDGDEIGLRQLLTNLLANALRISPPEGEVTVDLGVSGAQAEIAVCDRGPGIAPTDVDRIFEPFYTTAPSGSGGAGLGLTIAREVAERHGGSVHAANRPGGGACFRVRLPVGRTLTEAAPGSR